MELLLQILSVVVIICLIGAMLYATRAIKNKNDENLKKDHLRKAGLCFIAYAVLNVLRLLLEGNIQ